MPWYILKWTGFSKHGTAYYGIQWNLSWKTTLLAIKIWSLKTGGLWWQVQLHWNVGHSARNVVFQDRWSLKSVVSQNRFYCMYIWMDGIWSLVSPFVHGWSWLVQLEHGCICACWMNKVTACKISIFELCIFRIHVCTRTSVLHTIL